MTSDSWTAERLSAPRLHTLSAEGVRWPAPGLGPPAAREGGSSGPLFESQKSLILSRAETGIPELFFSTHIHRLPLCPFINTWEYKCFYSTIQFSSVAQSCPTLCDPRRQPTRLPRPWDSPGNNTLVGCHALLQEILPTQGLNPVSCIAGGYFTN